MDEVGNVEENKLHFIEEFCEKCVKHHNRCWCNTFDWDEEINIEKPTNLESEKPNQIFRQPPSGWSEFRRKTISRENKAVPESNNMTIKNCKSVSTENFKLM